MKDKIVPTYFGPLIVESVNHLGDGRVEVEFSDGKKEIMKQKTLDLSITPEKKDWNYLQEVKIAAMMGEIIPIILSYDLKMYEANSLIASLAKNVKERYSRAMNYLWTKDDSRYVEGSDPTDFFTICEAEAIIRSKDESQPTTGS